MSTLTAPVPAPADIRIRPVVGQLARAEAWRLARHPLVLVGLALSLAEGVAAAVQPAQSTGGLRFMFLAGSGHWPLAVGAFLAANAVALRSRRHGTAELEDTTVTSPAARTGALVVACSSTVVVAVLLLAANAVLFRAWDGVLVHLDGGFVARPMHVFELLQGPLVVLVMSLLGVALGRWLPTRVVGPLMLLPAVLGFFHSTWRFDGAAWSFSPLMAHERTAGWVQVTPGSGYSIIESFDVAGLGWHLVYLVGLALLLGAAAVARTHRSRAVGATAGVGLLVTTVGGVLQVV